MYTVLGDEVATGQVARRLANVLKNRAILGFSGEIGAGKTTFIRVLLESLGISGPIKSPTFSLVETYTIKNITCHHFDLYRIEDISELDYIGLRDYFSSDGIICIEWPEKVGMDALPIDLLITFQIEGSIRRMTFEALNLQGERMLSMMLANS